MRLINNIIIVVAIGLILGSASAWYSIQRDQGIGGIQAGSWTAWPFAGGAAADPYTMAKVSRDGTIPLGATEGLSFEATHDDENKTLLRNCNYVISGITPPSKLWTLSAYSNSGQPIKPSAGGLAAIHSANLLRFGDGSFRISISKNPRQGNWIGITGKGKFYLVFRIYDTPVSTTTGSSTPTMPKIINQGCDK